jgi:1A family penicillin-binding protein
MTLKAVATRSRQALAAVRARLTFRRIVRFASLAGLVAFVLVALEAAVRARLGDAESRIPTAIYTRPSAWGDGDETTPIAIGTTGQPVAEERVPVTLSEVPDRLVQAVVAVEDQRFYDHHGLDLKRIGGALVANIRAGGISQGGSTITQQLAKNLFLSAARTPVRKVREAAMALVLEVRYDKSAILEAYLNEVYLGQDGARAIHGVGAASRYYFGKSVRRISVPEAAMLAGMIQAPNRYNPTRNERWARQRRNLVLGLMADQDRISRRTAEQAERTRVGTRAHPAPSLDARYFRDLVLARLPGRLPQRGAAVYTTLDAGLQRAAEGAMSQVLPRLRTRAAQGALVAIDPRTGDILALVGGRDYGESQFDRATEARRQPGSAFKPIVALAALHRDGDDVPAFTLASRVEDEPLSVASGGKQWQPTNYDRSYRGEVTVRQAIEQSLNVPFARIGLAVGPDRIVKTARQLGITSTLHAVPSLALGSSEVSLLELVRAYGVFATEGRLATTRLVLGRSSLGDGSSLPPNGGPPELTQVASPAETYLVTSALEGVVARGTGRGLSAASRFGGVAGKTGTSNDWRDAWFVAYTPSLVVGVWVGFDDGRSLGLTGADAALPIVERFLEGVDPADRWESFPVPDGIEVAQVGASDDGWSFDCGTREVFLEGTAPRSECGEFDSSDWERRVSQWQDRVQSRASRLVARLLERLTERDDRGRGDRDRPDDGRIRVRFRP